MLLALDGRVWLFRWILGICRVLCLSPRQMQASLPHSGGSDAVIYIQWSSFILLRYVIAVIHWLIAPPITGWPFCTKRRRLHNISWNGVHGYPDLNSFAYYYNLKSSSKREREYEVYFGKTTKTLSSYHNQWQKLPRTPQFVYTQPDFHPNTVYYMHIYM